MSVADGVLNTEHNPVPAGQCQPTTGACWPPPAASASIIRRPSSREPYSYCTSTSTASLFQILYSYSRTVPVSSTASPLVRYCTACAAARFGGTRHQHAQKSRIIVENPPDAPAPIICILNCRKHFKVYQALATTAYRTVPVRVPVLVLLHPVRRYGTRLVLVPV